MTLIAHTRAQPLLHISKKRVGEHAVHVRNARCKEWHINGWEKKRKRKDGKHREVPQETQVSDETRWLAAFGSHLALSNCVTVDKMQKKKNTMILQGSLHRANNVQSCPQVCPSALTGHRGVRRWRNCLCFEKSRNLVKRWSIPENTSWLVPNRHSLHTLWLPVQCTLRKQTFTRFLCKVLGFVRRKKTHTSALKVPHSKTSNTSEALFSSPHVCDVQIR